MIPPPLKNYTPDEIDYARERVAIMMEGEKLLVGLGKKHYIKDDLKKYRRSCV